ncbi:MAG: DUF2934 domain-containing protein [Leptospiraceae bacterium]|nr:DUF2934 domain-containing protein [Leptospiraceae bacterium]
MNPDIIFCPGGDCPLKETCFRFTAIAYGRRSSFVSIPYSRRTNSCDQFISNKPKDEEIAKLAYFFYLEEGYPSGKDKEHWFRAEKELFERFNQN